MKRFQFLSVVTIAALVLLSLGASQAVADEPPGAAFPPPTAKRPAPPPPAAKTPAKKPAPAPESAWSPPAVTPGSTGSALPPPQVVRHRGAGLPPRSTPVAPSSTSPTSPTAPTAPTRGSPPRAPAIRDIPTWTPPRPLPPSPPSGLPTIPRAPALTQPAPVRPVPPRLNDAARSGTRIIGISKTHNVALTDGDLALQLDVDYEVRQQAGREVYVAIWFVRKDSGKHVRAALTSYADPGGFVTLQTQSARVPAAVGRYAATLRVPYRAFPVARGSDAYDVEARVQILRKERGGSVSALARGTSVFRVYGATEEDAPAAGPLPEPAPAAATEPASGPPAPKVTPSR